MFEIAIGPWDSVSLFGPCEVLEVTEHRPEDPAYLHIWAQDQESWQCRSLRLIEWEMGEIESALRQQVEKGAENLTFEGRAGKDAVLGSRNLGVDFQYGEGKGNEVAWYQPHQIGRLMNIQQVHVLT